MEHKSISKRFREFAIAFYKIAKYDLMQAENALDDGMYADAVFHSQQSVEKIVKSVLELREFFVGEHDLSRYFLEFVVEKSSNEWKDDLLEVLTVLDWFKGKWQSTRYPRIIGGKVVSPMDIHTKDRAEEALSKAHRVFDILTKFIPSNYDINLEEQ